MSLQNSRSKSKLVAFITPGLLIVVALAWIAVGELQVRAPRVEHNKKYLRPPVAIKNFTFGYNDMLASILWIRLLQNLDFCEGGKYSGEDFVHPVQSAPDKISGILERAIKPSRCNKGWVYSMLDVISEVNPRFHLAYDTGAMFLSVVVDDREGARLMFEKGLRIYPDNWNLSFHAGYHYLWEVQNAQRAAELFNQAARSGAPKWATALSAALYTKSGQVRLAKAILENALQNNPSGMDEERIKKRLDEVNALLVEE